MLHSAFFGAVQKGLQEAGLELLPVASKSLSDQHIPGKAAWARLDTQDSGQGEYWLLSCGLDSWSVPGGGV